MKCQEKTERTAIKQDLRPDFLYRLIYLVGSPEDLGSIPGRVITKDFQNGPCLTLSDIRYISRVKWSNPRKGVEPSPTSRRSSYWKGKHLVALDYGR